MTQMVDLTTRKERTLDIVLTTNPTRVNWVIILQRLTALMDHSIVFVEQIIIMWTYGPQHSICRENYYYVDLSPTPSTQHQKRFLPQHVEYFAVTMATKNTSLPYNLVHRHNIRTIPSILGC